MRRHDAQDGFSLIELLVVVIILGILAAIGIPRFLQQRTAANDAAAVADLRHLMTTETSLEATTGLTEDPDVLAAEGWEVSGAQIIVCAQVIGTDDIALTAWHSRGSKVYSWQRSGATIIASEVSLPADCDEATGGGATTVS